MPVPSMNRQKKTQSRTKAVLAKLPREEKCMEAHELCRSYVCFPRRRTEVLYLSNKIFCPRSAHDEHW